MFVDIHRYPLIFIDIHWCSLNVLYSIYYIPCCIYIGSCFFWHLLNHYNSYQIQSTPTIVDSDNVVVYSWWACPICACWKWFVWFPCVYPLWYISARAMFDICIVPTKLKQLNILINKNIDLEMCIFEGWSVWSADIIWKDHEIVKRKNSVHFSNEIFNICIFKKKDPT